MKKTNTLAWAFQKFDFWGVHLGGLRGGGDTPKLCQNICLLYNTDIKNTGTQG